MEEDPNDIFNIKREHNQLANDAERPKLVEPKEPANDSINNKTRTRANSSNTSSTKLSESKFTLYSTQNNDFETKSDPGAEQEQEQEQEQRPRSQTL